jgi:hypothetical protein
VSQTLVRRHPSAARPVSKGGTPWSRVDVVRATVLIAVGALVWAIGWYRLAGEPAFGEQVGPMNIAIVGFVFVCAGQMAWFLGGRRAVSDRRRVLLGREAAPPVVESAEPGADSFAGSERFYHRLECSMVDDRAWTPTSRAAQEQAGRLPCGVCAP